MLSNPKNHNFKKLQASSLQFIISQSTTILLFFVTSKFLSKESLASFNWLTAFYVTVGSVLSFGIEQLIIKIVAEQKSVNVTKIYLFHVFGAIVLFACGLWSYFAVTKSFNIYYLFFSVWMLINLINVALKNTLIGFEFFSNISKISILSGSVKLIGIIFFFYTSYKTIETVLLILIVSLVFESILSFIQIKKTTNWKNVHVDISQEYLPLLKKAFPQFIVVIFGVALARFDWIYIGLIESADTTAEYTFAYKMFEFAKLPLLIISPILLPLFSRIFANPISSLNNQYQTNLKQLYSVELFLAGFIPITFASFWNLVLNFLFDNKYGTSNYFTFCLLCLAIPMQYSSDYYWNLIFSQSKYKLSSFVSVVTTIFNIILVLVLTPLLSSTGAAIAFSASSFLPFILFYISEKKSIFKVKMTDIFIIYALILVSFFAIYLLNHNAYLTFLIPLSYAFILIKANFIDIKKLKTIFLK